MFSLPSFCSYISEKHDHFAKTGLGQTYEKLIAGVNSDSTEAKTLWKLVRGLSEAILVWNNISGNIHCIDVHVRDSDDDDDDDDIR